MAVIRVRNEFLREWIDGTTIQKLGGDCDSQNGTTADTGFAWALYDHVLQLFSIIVPLSSSKSSKKDVRSLKELLGKFFLWGDGFCHGRLESVLDESDDLKETVVGELAGIGNILISRKLSPQNLDDHISDSIQSLLLHARYLRFLRRGTKSVTLLESSAYYLRRQNKSLRVTTTATQHQAMSQTLPQEFTRMRGLFPL
jgi:hypothetical protein